MQRISDGWVVNPKQDYFPPRLRKVHGTVSRKNEGPGDTEKGMQYSAPDTVIGVKISQPLELFLLGLHKNGLIISQPWIRGEFLEPCFS